MAVGTGGQPPPPNILPTKKLELKEKTYKSLYSKKAKIDT